MREKRQIQREQTRHMRESRLIRMLLVTAGTCALLWGTIASPLSCVSGQAGDDPAASTDDLLFIHHSCGSNWLGNDLHNALLAKDYIDERNDITYGTDLSPDSGRADSLGPTPGENTNMNHWIRWFNDYLGGIRAHGAATGYNRIVMFKSCYPISNVTAAGTEPGSPFDGTQTLANYKSVYRHPSGPGNTYSNGGLNYKPLEDIFAENPNVLFIPVTAPPLNYSSTTDANAHRARLFNNWLKTDWLNSYNTAHPGLHNVAVFDWFDVLAYPDSHASHPNRLKQEYGGATGDSHPNATANAYSTEVFATNPDNFIDNAWENFVNATPPSPRAGIYASPQAAEQNDLITFSVVITGPLTTAAMTSTVPAGLAYQPSSMAATSGVADDSGAPTLHWTGSVTASGTVTVTYETLVVTADRAAIADQVQISAPGQNTQIWETTLIVNGAHIFCPLILKSAVV